MNPRLVMLVLLAASCKDRPAGSASPVIDEVVHDLASNAFGNQKIDRSCVSASPAAMTETSEVIGARLVDEDRCGDKTTRGMTWVFVRPKGGAWKEEFLGPTPRCWQGLPPELADAIAKATAIPAC
jgi:hypothetical protein